jgi:hypothetical protein
MSKGSNEKLIHPVYLPFSEGQLKQHFIEKSENLDLHLAYYLKSADRYKTFEREHPNREALPLSVLRLPCQIEKDERFWVVTCLMNYFYSSDRVENFSKLLELVFGNSPPSDVGSSWSECLAGNLRLFFEVSLPAPKAYKEWLRENIDSRQVIPYVPGCLEKQKGDEIRENLEGPTPCRCNTAK